MASRANVLKLCRVFPLPSHCIAYSSKGGRAEISSYILPNIESRLAGPSPPDVPPSLASTWFRIEILHRQLGEVWSISTADCWSLSSLACNRLRYDSRLNRQTGAWVVFEIWVLCVRCCIGTMPLRRFRALLNQLVIPFWREHGILDVTRKYHTGQLQKSVEMSRWKTSVSHHARALCTVYVVGFILIVDYETELGSQKNKTMAYQVQVGFLAQLDLFIECWVGMS